MVRKRFSHIVIIDKGFLEELDLSFTALKTLNAKRTETLPCFQEPCFSIG